MGYHVTILRSRDRRQVPIPRADVEAALASRPDLAAAPGDGGALEITVPALGDASPLLVFEDGELWTKNPDDATLALMLELATALDARVRGDELETYRSADETYVHPDDAAVLAASKVDVTKMRRRARLLTFAPFAVFVLLSMLVGWCSR